MDRYSGRDRDDDAPLAPMPAVGKTGLSSFVKADQGMGQDLGQDQDQPISKVEISVSRREQKRRQSDVAAMLPPPPPPTASTSQPTRPTGLPAPVWAGQPPPGFRLRVLKDSVPLSELPLERPMTVFGRGAAVDVHLDHQSISRQHAAVCYQRMTGKWMVLDWGSVHGSFVDGKQLVKNVSVELREGSFLRFAASSRVYCLQRSALGTSVPEPDTADDRQAASRVTGGGGAEQHPKRARIDDAEGLEQTQGSSSRQAPQSGGPRPVDTAGQFAHLVETAVVKSKDVGTAASRQLHKRGSEGMARRPAALQPLRTGLYDRLPPASGGNITHS